MTNKESFQVLGIGFLFSAIYVGILALFPVAWAIGNLVLLFIVLYINRKKSRLSNRNNETNKKPCNASWQVSVHGGNLYEIKCRNCGVRVESGGTPICRNNGDTSIL